MLLIVIAALISHTFLFLSNVSSANISFAQTFQTFNFHRVETQFHFNSNDSNLVSEKHNQRRLKQH